MFIGSVLDSYKALGNINAGYNLIFTICGCTYLIALLIIHLLTRNKVKVKLEEIQ
jgi:ACS family hexuronate transporter-like MFS transporter